MSYEQLQTGQSNKEATVNNNFSNLSPVFAFGINQVQTAGLSLSLYEAKLKGKTFNESTLTLAANSTNYIEADLINNVVLVNQTAFTESDDRLKLWRIKTNATGIIQNTETVKTNIVDERTYPLISTDYTPSIATAIEVGVVKAGSGLKVDEQGKLDVEIDGTTIILNAEGKMSAVGGGSGGGGGGGDGGSGLTYLEEDKTSLPGAILLKPNATNTESALNLGFLTKAGSFIVSYEGFIGNARGASSIDIQTARTLATQVANGARAVAIGSELTADQYSVNIGYKNITTGHSSRYSGIVVGQECEANVKSIAFGFKAIASNANVSIALGQSATASGGWSIALGESVTASANGSFCAGRSSISNGQYAFVYGDGANAHGQNGGLVLGNKFSSTASSTEGTAQLRLNTYYGTLQSSTLSRSLTANGNANPSTANQFSLVNYQRRFFKILVQMSEDKATGAEAAFKVTGYIKRDNGASTTQLLTSTITPVYVSELATTNGYSVSVSASTSLGCLLINCSASATTSSAHTIKCVATTYDNQVIVAP